MGRRPGGGRFGLDPRRRQRRFASAEDARTMLALSGAAGVMIGRAAVGAPWLVGALTRALDDGGPALEPSQEERREAALEHLDWLVGKLGPRAGLRHARKHLAAYADQARAEVTLRRALVIGEDVAKLGGCLPAPSIAIGSGERHDRARSSTPAGRRKGFERARPAVAHSRRAGHGDRCQRSGRDLFRHGPRALLRSRLTDLIPSDSPVLALVADALSNRAPSMVIKSTFPRLGSVIETMSTFSLRRCRRRTTLSRSCCKNVRLPKK